MHDIKAIRENTAAFVAALSRRPAYAKSAQSEADTLLAKDKELRDLLTSLQQKQARRNEASKEIGKAKGQKDEAKASELMNEVASLKNDIQSGEQRERELQEEMKNLLAVLPNLPADDVPNGAEESDNVPVPERAFGSKPTMNSAQEHFELGDKLGMMDFERAVKVSGSRFVYLKSGLAKLNRALASFMLDTHTEQYGYTEVNPPVLVRDPAMYGTGQLPKFKDDLFATSNNSTDIERRRLASTLAIAELQRLGKTHFAEGSKVDQPNDVFEYDEEAARQLSLLENPDRLWLIPTAEVSLTNYVNGEILDEAELPIRFTAYTPCFRSEAGAAGKDTRGMIRMHQFDKVELVSITAPEDSLAEHERMTDAAQNILKKLDLHHRVVTLCTGDMGFGAQKTYDIEVWLPGQGRFREISSCSNCGDFQARRMNTRLRGKDGKVKGPVHTLNGSGLAIGRTLIAVMENYQQQDGSIAIPAVLQPYMGGKTKIEKAS